VRANVEAVMKCYVQDEVNQEESEQDIFQKAAEYIDQIHHCEAQNRNETLLYRVTFKI